MKTIQTFLTGLALTAVVGATSVAIYHCTNKNAHPDAHFPTSRYGAYLAAQHAIYVNDFDRARQFANEIKDTEYASIQNTKYLADFLSGHIPDGVKLLHNEKNVASRLIYDAYLVQNDDWAELYNRHKNDESALTAPLRVWGAVATKNTKTALKIVDNLPTNTSYKAFVRGQIYAETGEIDKAAKNFADVDVGFMNINDYMYIMAFYKHNDMTDAARALHDDFTAQPGGMFMLGNENLPDWNVYSGTKNALAFSLVQNVSHTQIMMYSDLAILLLRFAQITGTEFGQDTNSINYYLGQYFYTNHGDYEKYFNRIEKSSPYYPFAVLRIADRNGDYRAMWRVLDEYPLFVPIINKLIAHGIQQGYKRDAMRALKHALSDENLTDQERAFFIKSRAQINYVFGDYDAAQHDIHDAANVLPLDGEILMLQAKIWAAQNRELDTAYEYAMSLVQTNPADVQAWDTVGRVVAVREGADAALDVIQRVGDVANTCSSLFEQLGDLYLTNGDKNRARDAYLRAIDLSDDGLVVVPQIQKKLRKLK